nr:MAG TPA: Major capsid protein [Caudoviricetes sp.]
MSYQTFKPEVWAELTNRNLNKQLVFGALANRNYEGKIENIGSSVRVPSIGSVTVGDYTGADITFQEDTGAYQTININKAKYFALKMDDVDKAQAIPGVIEALTDQAIYEMADVVDIELAKLYAKCKSKVAGVIGTDKVSDKIIDLAVKMDEDNVPTANRWLVISPEIYGQLIKEVPTISKGENTLGINQSYFIGSWGGFTIYKSNNVQRTAKKYHCMAGVSAGLTLAMQINKMEAGRFEKSFGEYVKGLQLFGCDVMETETGKTKLLCELEISQA